MKRSKKMKWLSTGLALFFSIQMCVTSVELIPVCSNVFEPGISTTQAEIMSTTTVWRYKKEHGKTYKRLYDYSKKQWIGDWILVS